MCDTAQFRSKRIRRAERRLCTVLALCVSIWFTQQAFLGIFPSLKRDYGHDSLRVTQHLMSWRDDVELIRYTALFQPLCGESL